MFILVTAGIVAVFLAMNVLAVSAPLALNASSGPSTSPTPSFAETPSDWPLDTPTDLETPVPSVSLPPTPPTIITSVVAAESRGVWSYHLVYPAFLAGTTPWAEQINSDTYEGVQARALQWAGGPAANPRPSGKVNTLMGSFEEELLTPELASFTLNWTDDSRDEYPGLGCETLNFDLRTGHRVSFDSVFNDTRAALTIMSGIAQASLKEQLGADYDAWLVSDGTAPTADHYIHWALMAGGVKITFDQYQVTTRQGPLLSVVVPWDRLRQVIVQTSPVANLAGLSSPSPSERVSPSAG
jgi:hypothetical protein